MSNITKTATKGGGPLPGLLRPPIIFLAAILLGIALDRAWSFHFLPSALWWLGPIVVLCAVVNFVLPALRYGEVSAPLRSCALVLTGSAAIPSMCLSLCSCSDCQFG